MSLISSSSSVGSKTSKVLLINKWVVLRFLLIISLSLLNVWLSKNTLIITTTTTITSVPVLHNNTTTTITNTNKTNYNNVNRRNDVVTNTNSIQQQEQQQEQQQQEVQQNIQQEQKQQEQEQVKSRTTRNIAENLIVQNHIFCGGCFNAPINIDNNINNNNNNNGGQKSTCGRQIKQIVQMNLPSSITTTNNNLPLTQIIMNLRQSNQTLYTKLMQNAAYSVSVKFPFHCYRCNPERCNSNNNNNTGTIGDVFHRYDTGAPQAIRSWTHYLTSIPQEKRLPPYAMHDLDNFFNNDNNTNHNFLFEFNPSIAILPFNQRQNYTTSTGTIVDMNTFSLI